ncbi:xylose isomerase domain protein TIM barrel [Candidatus Vecturithrix granuli]|uniref:Xylose isomerase domain protein TIM barrel n=1 Tax=Vecturithrix granuli TaxID=1499967 RepID=A0A081C3T8_VECG1|nr:xylose isomerase domain protein TIM barrel [Candidatus Vecturithrix granuli]
MQKQNFEIKNEKIQTAFLNAKKNHPEKFAQRLNLSWSNWGFGMESLADSAARLQQAGIQYIELHGNHYGTDLGYKPQETLNILGEHNLKVAGICGMFSVENDLSSNRAIHRQAALDYLKREVPFAAAVGASYILVVPGAVGRPAAYDNMEFDRSVETLQLVADLFTTHAVKAAIEPIRSAEVSFVHTIADAKRYIQAVNHPGVRHINGDVYHMQSEETHIGEAILEAGEMLTNLHVADSNRCALGEGALDLDTLIMALYLIGYNRNGCFVTPEPLGPGGDPYPAMYGKPNKELLDKLVQQTARYFREREEVLLNL